MSRLIALLLISLSLFLFSTSLFASRPGVDTVSGTPSAVDISMEGSRIKRSKGGSIDDALKLYLEALEKDPTDVSTRFHVMNAYDRKKEYKKALKVAQQHPHFKSLPSADQARLLTFQAVTNQRLGQYEKALEISQKARQLKLDPHQTAQVLMTQAFSARKLERYDEALEFVQEISRSGLGGDQEVKILISQAIYSREAGRYDTAWELSEAALKLNSDHSQKFKILELQSIIAGQKALADNKRESFDAALGTALKLLEGKPTAEQRGKAGTLILTHAGKAHAKGFHDAAIKATRALSGPEFLDTHRLQAWITQTMSYHGIGKHSEVLESSKNALELLRDKKLKITPAQHVRLLLTQSISARELGQYEKVFLSLEEALKQAPADDIVSRDKIYKTWAVSLSKAGEPREALRMLDQIVKADVTTIRHRISKALSRSGAASKRRRPSQQPQAGGASDSADSRQARDRTYASGEARGRSRTPRAHERGYDHKSSHSYHSHSGRHDSKYRSSTSRHYDDRYRDDRSYSRSRSRDRHYSHRDRDRRSYRHDYSRSRSRDRGYSYRDRGSRSHRHGYSRSRSPVRRGFKIR